MLKFQFDRHITSSFEIKYFFGVMCSNALQPKWEVITMLANKTKQNT